MSIGERIEERRKAIGISQAELARRVNLGQSTINGLIRGGSRSSAHLHKIASVLRTSVQYLAGETDDAEALIAPPLTREEMAAQLDLVPIASIDLEYGMGGTFMDVGHDEEVRLFPRGFIETITRSPAALLTFAKGRGDSMAPTINDSDLVLIDRSQRVVREQDALWAFTIGDVGMIKRLRVRGEKVTILSDNDRIPPDEADVDEVHIVGRINFIGKRV
nr:S24 family peptidase [uncultured Sphingomonas sp.]